VSQKTFFKSDKVQLKWNQLGTTLIVLAQTEVDKTGKSYYGETTLYVLSANGGFDSRITLDKEGPIHDVSWSPNSKEFGVVYGYMPAKTTIFNQRAVATHTFPLSPRNTILFSPTGRFVLVAGFGNLAGQMDIYDLEKDYQKICTIEGGNPSVCEWSPDSKYILTATTSPRLRVDNGVRLWHVGGGIMYNEDMVELYHVTWRPQAFDHFSPGDLLHPVPNPHASALAYLGTVKTPSKPAGAYRPPGARGTSTPLHFKREDEGGAAHIVSNGTSLVGSNGFGKPRRQVPGAETVDTLPSGAAPANGPTPGAAEGDENLSKAALKNKKKREAKKAKDAEAKAAGLTPASDGPAAGGENRSPERRDRREHQRSRSKGQQDVRTPSQGRYRSNTHQGKHNGPNGAAPTGQINNLSINLTSTRVQDTPELSVTSPGGGSPNAKKLRGLQKKIRAIEDLEMRLAGGEKLEDTQMKKIGTKTAVQAELASLEAEA
jgi:translation initiation factor 2A